FVVGVVLVRGGGRVVDAQLDTGEVVAFGGGAVLAGAAGRVDGFFEGDVELGAAAVADQQGGAPLPGTGARGRRAGGRGAGRRGAVVRWLVAGACLSAWCDGGAEHEATRSTAAVRPMAAPSAPAVRLVRVWWLIGGLRRVVASRPAAVR